MSCACFKMLSGNEEYNLHLQDKDSINLSFYVIILKCARQGVLPLPRELCFQTYLFSVCLCPWLLQS